MRIINIHRTALESAEKIKRLPLIISEGEDEKIIVLPSIEWIKTVLVTITALSTKNEKKKAEFLLEKIAGYCKDLVMDLMEGHPLYKEITQETDARCSYLTSSLNNDKVPVGEILASGERLTSIIIFGFLKSRGLNPGLVPATDYMRINNELKPDIFSTSQLLSRVLFENEDKDLIITTGGIGCFSDGLSPVSFPGGSDLTATVIGNILNIKRVEFWSTDSTIYNIDPAHVSNAEPISCLTFEEAAELFPVLNHRLEPSCLYPSKEKNIEINLKNIFSPGLPGTVIQSKCTAVSGNVKVITARSGYIAIKIQSPGMYRENSTFKKILMVFEQYLTSIDMITTSNVSISFTISNHKYLKELLEDLTAFGEVSFQENQTLISLIGQGLGNSRGIVARMIYTLNGLPLRMINAGGSDNHLSILIDSKYQTEALNQIHHGFFIRKEEKISWLN